MKEVLQSIWLTYMDIAPYLFWGLTIAGLLHIFFRKDFILKHLGKSNLLSTLKASVLGVPLPLCSCGVIPTAMYLRKQKASRGATLSFLISTPQTGVDSIIATYGMMGPVFALFRPIAAFITGIVGGISANLFFKKDNADEMRSQDSKVHCETCEVTIPHHHTLLEKVRSGFYYAFKDFLDDISLQLVFGILLAGIISFAIPDNFFAKYGGDGFLGMLYMIIFGIPLYVCATASIPIAVSLIIKGISPGAAFVFLVVGPATNAATITLIANALGKKMVAIYLTVISVFAILGGLLLNIIFDFLKTQPMELVRHSHQTNSIVFTLFMALFSIALILSLLRKIREKLSGVKNNKIKSDDYDSVIKIQGMTCNHCVMTVERAIRAVPGVTETIIDLDNGIAGIKGDFSVEDIKEAVENVGYRIH